MKKQQTIYRQGDVIMIRVDKMPSGLTEVQRESGRVILAHGELTGHAHAIADAHASLRTTAEGRTFLIVDEIVELRHEEHSAVALPPGVYQTVRQTEYAPEALRNVAD